MSFQEKMPETQDVVSPYLNGASVRSSEQVAELSTTPETERLTETSVHTVWLEQMLPDLLRVYGIEDAAGAEAMVDDFVFGVQEANPSFSPDVGAVMREVQSFFPITATKRAGEVAVSGSVEVRHSSLTVNKNFPN